MFTVFRVDQRLRHVALAAAIGGLAVTACRDASGPGGPVAPSTEVMGNQRASVGMFEGLGRPSFGVRIQARGPFRPRVPFEVVVSVSSNKTVRRAQINLSTPDWLAGGAITGGRPTTSWSVSIDSGQTLEFRRTLVPQAAGYYTLQGSITQQSDERSYVFPSRGEGAIVWVLVDQSGGALTSHFSPRRFPRGMLPSPGPFTVQMRPSDTAFTPQLCDPGDPTCGPQRGCCVSGSVTYLEQPNDVRSMRDVLVYMRIFNPVTGATLLTQTTRTNSGGSYAGLPCLLTGESATITIQTVHARFFVSDSRANTAPTLYPAYPSSCNNSINMYFQTDGAAVYERLLTVTDNELSKYGRLQPPIEVRISDSTSYGPYPTKSFYTRAGASGPKHVRIQVPAIGGQLGTNDFEKYFVTAHEFGHAFLDNAFFSGDAGYGNCGPEHFVNSVTNPKCAYSEGFADAHTVATQPVAAEAFDFETTNYGNIPNGYQIEGAVAAYFLDVTDPTANTSTERDFLATPYSFLNAVIDNCQAKPSGSWVGAFDLRDFRLCFENRTNGTTVRLSPTSPNFGQTATWSLANMSNDYVWNVDGTRN